MYLCTCVSDMSKRRKPAALAYDYEAAYDKTIEDLKEEQILQMIRARHPACVYATKEIRSGDRLEVEIYPEFARGQSAQIPTQAQREKQRKAQRDLNERNSRKHCERLIEANFTAGDLWITLTYQDDQLPEDMTEALKNMQNFIRRVNRIRKRKGLPNAKYVYVTEGIEGGRFHHHLVMDGALDSETVEAAWKKGRRNQIRKLDPDDDGLAGMAKYITKEKKKKCQKRYTPTKGLKQPEERVNHYKFRCRDVHEMARDAAAIEPPMDKRYAQAGYRFRSAEVRYNEFNGRFYVYARLHRSAGPEQAAGPGQRKKYSAVKHIRQ